MLKFMRKHTNSWFIKIILGMIVVTFVGFFGWNATQNNFSRDVIAVVDDEPISLVEYQAAYQKMHDFFRQVYGKDLDQSALKNLQLGRQTLEVLVRSKMQVRQAKRAGLSVSDEELADHIEDISTFQSKGQFDRALYLEVLRRSRLSISDYEAEQRQALLLRKIESVIRDGVKVTKPEIEEAYQWSHEGLKVRYLIYPSDRLEKDVKVREDALAKYFDKEKERFRRPKKIKVSYVFGKTSEFQNTVKVTDQEITKAYEETKEKYREPEKRRVRHILFKVAPEASLERAGDVRAKIEALLKRIRSGESFNQLADKFSDDLNAGEGGNLGAIVRGEMAPAFEKAVFGLDEGEVSNPVRTSFGYHLVKVDGIEPTRVQPLSEVKASITAKMRMVQASENARDEIEKIWDEISKGRKLQSLTKIRGIQKGTSEFFTSDGRGLVLPDGRKVASAAFRLDRGELSDPIEGEAGWYLFRVIDERPSRLPALKEARSEAEKAYVRKEAGRLTEERVKGWVNALNGGKDLTEIAKVEGLKVTETPLFKRVEPLSSPRVGQDFYQRVFELSPGEAGEAYVANGRILFVVSERKGAELSSLKKDDGKFRAEYLRSKRAMVLKSWVTARRQEATIEIRPEFKL